MKHAVLNNIKKSKNIPIKLRKSLTKYLVYISATEAYHFLTSEKLLESRPGDESCMARPLQSRPGRSMRGWTHPLRLQPWP
jgi:hypothetical protein